MLQRGGMISRYRIIGPLGKGGMGEVYHAEDTRLQRPVALKFLSSELTEPDRKRFLNEAQAAALVRHPNICPIYDVDEADGQIFIAMAYLEGETLQRRIARGPLPFRQVIDIGIQLASGLEKAHELGIVHRDIKSNNIIVNAEGHACILDFGLALRSGASRLTQAGQAVGTIGYMSPEQIKGLDVDGRTDIWALGVVLYEMLTGRHPFRRDQDAAILYAILSEDPAPISALRPDTPPVLQRVVEKALAHDPERRWQRVRDIVDQLRRLQESGASSAVLDFETSPTQIKTIAMPVVPAVGRKRAVWAGILLTIVATIAGLTYFGWTRYQQPALHPAVATQLVAVLPFQVIGSAGNAAAVADGLVEILTAALSDFQKSGGKFTVVPASEVRHRNIATVGDARRIYGVNLAITGSAQPLGNKLQFTVALVDGKQIRQLGARTFEYDPADPVRSRDHAVEQVAGLLQIDWHRGAQTTSAAGDSPEPGAYAAYLEGRGLLARYDVQGNLPKAIMRFKAQRSRILVTLWHGRD